MSASENDYEFLKEITPQNISNARVDFQLKFDDYNTFYIVDTYDIIEYCFPFIFNPSFKYKTKKPVSDFLSYQLFYFGPGNKPIILDEYKIEIFAFWYRLQKKIIEYSNYNNLKNSLIERYREAITKDEKIIFIQSNVGLLLSIAFGTLSKTPIDRYNSLVTKRLQFESIELEDKNDQLIIEDIFIETKPSIPKVNKVFDDFCEKIKWKLLGKTDEEKIIYFENSYRDIEVYDRLININKKIVLCKGNSKLNGKYNFFYLSSAPVKSELIEFSYRDDFPQNTGINYKSIRRSNLDIYIYQLFDIGQSKQNQELIIQFLDNLESVSKTYTNNAKKIEKYKELFMGSILPVDNSVLKRKIELDDIFLKYQSINNYHKKINAAIKVLNRTGDDANLFKEFINILDKASENESLENLTFLQNSIERYNDTLLLKSGIISDLDYLINKKYPSYVQRFPGSDFIRNLVSSFPILLFYKNNNIKNIQYLFKEIITPKTEMNEIVSDFIKFHQSAFYEFTTIEKKLFFLFVRYVFDKELSEEMLLSDVDMLMVLNNKSKFEQLLNDKNLIVNLLPNKKTRNELLYFKTWILRRINRHDEGIKIINELENKEKTIDIRLNHSRALCYKNKYYNEINLKNPSLLNVYLLTALKDFKLCEREYKEFLNLSPNNFLIAQSLLAISNSIIDTYVRLFLLDYQKYLSKIKECRERIDDLKKKIPESGFKYDLYPTISHTEVDLEYCEALIAIQNNDRELASNKLREANIRLGTIENSKILTDYEPLLKSIKNVRKLIKSSSSK